MDKQAELARVSKDMLERDVCADLRRQATQLVSGVGSADAEVMFIGEAPGQKEDEQGEPFVGAAGKFLDEMLESIGLDRKTVFITNIVKYRPPNNRDPEPEEITASLPYLLRQIAIIQPRIIATLGRFSMNVFLPDQKISHIHGQPKRIRLKLGMNESLVGRQGAETLQGVSKRSDAMRLEVDARQRRGAEEDTANEVGRQGAEALQGGEETRSESYKRYDERESQSPTQQGPASSSGVTSSAREQATASLVVLPLYHPAAALYNGSQRQVLMDDFARIPKIMEKITQLTVKNKE